MICIDIYIVRTEYESNMYRRADKIHEIDYYCRYSNQDLVTFCLASPSSLPLHLSRFLDSFGPPP